MALSLVLASRSASFSARVVGSVYPKFKFLAWCCARILYRLINDLDYLDVFVCSLILGLSDELLEPDHDQNGFPGRVMNDQFEEP
jgi:hypothetical protein